MVSFWNKRRSSCPIAKSSSWLALRKLFVSYLHNLLIPKFRAALSSIASDRQKT
ncbi:hypothetical protein [Nostoc sp.]|uniref:hypothetical protein n=1 Tax=Nostoc sp. TaxID=1180 RepID=UPI002FFBF640